MTTACAHADPAVDVRPNAEGCEECLRAGGTWRFLRVCLECGHIGCCNDSPGKHATTHFESSGHPVVRSFEPGQNWYWCYVDEQQYEIEGSPPAPSHP